MFGETGFGTVANATFVNTNAEYDKTRFDRSFVITGLSDSYNLVGFYENDKYQVRLAYNWRDEFLMDFRNNEPVFVEAYGQWDLSASYNLTENLTITLDGINITSEENLHHARFSNQFLMAEESGPRYTLGVRASF
jgi:TonB-dependent receptor